jgi:signal transduction histidine kinase
MLAEKPASMISDVSLLCEAEVSLVAAAYVLSTLNLEVLLHQICLLPGATTIVNGQVTETRKGSVPIILHISQADWEFVCLSGAFQRIVMNLVGDSLKFTDSGFVQIHLSIKPPNRDGEHGHLQGTLKREVLLSVRDSGKGIESYFLKNKVFRPFSQESVLDPGNGVYHNLQIST